jgi:release factor glutamine methyltransferase
MKQIVAHALNEAAKILKVNGIVNARRDADLLLASVLEKNLTYLIAHNDDFINDQSENKYRQLVKRRAAGEPLQYIIGKQEFYGLEFEVNPSVLIPRPETELLVEAALEILRECKSPTLCDVGTGSGCIAISVVKNIEKARAVSLDISPKALQVAERNAEKNGVAEKITFAESDVFSAFANPKSKIQNPKFDLIVSNPPYIPDSDLPTLEREVREHEPHNALFSGSDGLNLIKRLLADAKQFLEKNGFLLFEIGFGQSGKIEALIDQSVWQLIEIRRDLQNIGRVVVLKKKC